MDIHNRLWSDLRNFKHWDLYLSGYLAKSKDNAKKYKIALIIVSGIGTISYPYAEWAALIACILIFVSQMLNELQYLFILDDPTIEKISSYRMLHVRYFNKLDRLWCDYNTDEVDEKEAIKRYFELRSLQEEIDEIDNSLRIKTFKSLNNKISIKTDAYLKNHYY